MLSQKPKPDVRLSLSKPTFFGTLNLKHPIMTSNYVIYIFAVAELLGLNVTFEYEIRLLRQPLRLLKSFLPYLAACCNLAHSSLRVTVLLKTTLSAVEYLLSMAKYPCLSNW